MDVAERKNATAAAEAQEWLTRFGDALQAQDAKAAAELFLTDGLWRDVLAFTWNLQTQFQRGQIEATLRETLPRTQPANFHIPAKRTPPRWVNRAGRDTIEVISSSRPFGPCHGVAAVPDGGALRAWTLVTICGVRGHEEFKKPEPWQRHPHLRRRELARPAEHAARLADHDPAVSWWAAPGWLSAARGCMLSASIP